MLGRLGSMQHAKGYDENDEYGERDEDDEDDEGGSKGCWSHDDDADSIKK